MKVRPHHWWFVAGLSLAAVVALLAFRRHELPPDLAESLPNEITARLRGMFRPTTLSFSYARGMDAHGVDLGFDAPGFVASGRIPLVQMRHRMASVLQRPLRIETVTLENPTLLILADVNKPLRRPVSNPPPIPSAEPPPWIPPPWPRDPQLEFGRTRLDISESDIEIRSVRPGLEFHMIAHHAEIELDNVVVGPFGPSIIHRAFGRGRFKARGFTFNGLRTADSTAAVEIGNGHLTFTDLTFRCGEQRFSMPEVDVNFNEDLSVDMGSKVYTVLPDGRPGELLPGGPSELQLYCSVR